MLKTPQPENHPEIRRALVERIRREIQQGTYDTPDKWWQALERLIEHADLHRYHDPETN
jgi:hypothetical protein